jgi:hypothetical protein
MANGLISYINHVDASDTIIAADSELASLPVANVADSIVQRRWQIGAGTASGSLQVDFGSNVSIELLGLFGVSFASADTVRHRLSAVSMGAGELFDSTALASGVVSGYGQTVSKLDAAVSARYWQCDIAASAAFYVGRAWAGPVWNFERNFSLGATEDEVDGSTVTRAARSGVAYVDIGPTLRSAEFALEAMSSTDRASARAMIKAVGRRSQVVYVPDPDSADLNKEALLGLLDGWSAISQPHLDYFARSARILEAK